MGVQVPLVAPHTHQKYIQSKIYFLLAPIFIFLLRFHYTGMKGLRLFFAVLLVPLVFQAAFADDELDTSRAATRRGTTTTISGTRQKPAPQTTANNKNTSHTTPKRTVPTSGQNTVVRERTTTQQRVSPRGTNTQTVQRTKPAGNTSITPRSGQQKILSRTTTAPVGRTATTQRYTSGATAARTASSTRTAAGTTRTAGTTINRSATRARAGTTTTSIEIGNYQKCRQVFNECMDEFCANKDSQLKRCACSSRISEFNTIKASLAETEEKLLDFSQRLLTVSMDKEDVLATQTQTEGELAFNSQSDNSKSKQMLEEITKKLNNSFNNSDFDQQLNNISLSLNTDAAFDTVDSLAGASTTTKTGVALHNAALPVCREMALEICTPDELAIAESGYQMLIEQDCNTVKKGYQTQADLARKQVFESGALLDMSRLDVYQNKNSDDILSCRTKMLDMLTDSSVCGSDLGKCLDTTGRYIDPSTGQAFLTTELVNLSNLITRPAPDETWMDNENNQRFVTFLNSKKIFLEPAMKHCEDISDYVWELFIEDALAQIKLAQNNKLEEIRQSCTTLTTQCLDNATKSITDFDARALSVFGVQANKTVNAICADIQESCTALINSYSPDNEWSDGMTDISADQTYETILSTCREVGRACIIRTCTSVTGNFGLCESIDKSINRKAIISGSVCWNEVVSCISDADKTALANIKQNHKLTDGNFYNEMYGTDTGDIVNTKSETSELKKCTQVECDGDNCTETKCTYDKCNDKCEDANSDDCYRCRLAERIWGNCESDPATELNDKNSHNRIKTTLTDIASSGTTTETLLEWFAKNTNTADLADNCRDTTCPAGYTLLCGNDCVLSEHIDSSKTYCPIDQFIISGTNSNCCTTETKDTWGNCCRNQGIDINSYSGRTTTTGEKAEIRYGDFNDYTPGDTTICTDPTTLDEKPKAMAKYTVTVNNKPYTYTVYCYGNILTTASQAETNFPNGTELTCEGKVVWIDNNGIYDDKTGTQSVTNHYLNGSTARCYYDDDQSTWVGTGCDWISDNSPANPPAEDLSPNWYVSYQNLTTTDPLKDCQ